MLSDAGEKIAAYTALMIGADNALVVSHNALAGPTFENGSASVVPVLDYADPGPVKVAFVVPDVTDPSHTASEPSSQV